jgi:cytochrome c-type biogenesis protein CcmH/NrfF
MSPDRLSACLIAVAIVVGGAGAGAAAGRQQAPAVALGAEQTSAEAARLFREVMSPFCPGLTLADCPSPNAFTLRDEIETRLARGESRAVILNELVGTYGTQILADPSDTPIGTIVWGVPFALAALAAMGIALVVRRATRTHGTEPALAVAGSPGLTDRLEEELARID